MVDYYEVYEEVLDNLGYALDGSIDIYPEDMPKLETAEELRALYENEDGYFTGDSIYADYREDEAEDGAEDVRREIESSFLSKLAQVADEDDYDESEAASYVRRMTLDLPYDSSMFKGELMRRVKEEIKRLGLTETQLDEAREKSIPFDKLIAK